MAVDFFSVFVFLHLAFSTYLNQRHISSSQQVECRQQHPATTRLLRVFYLEKLGNGAARNLCALIGRSLTYFGYHEAGHVVTELMYVTKLVRHVSAVAVPKHLKCETNFRKLGRGFDF